MQSSKKQIKRLQGSSYVISLEPSDVLGQGSFGKVVRAFDMDNKGEQLVAKIIELNSQSKIESLKIEMKVLEAFQSEHHNLVAFKRLKLFSKKCYYIIMECCNGGTLEEKFNKTKVFALIEIIDFLSQFCSGYRELYRQDIIHRGEEAIADPKVDMWSLGICIFRMMYAGQFPYLLPQKMYSNRQQAFNDILQNPLLIPSHPVHSKELIDLLKRMLEKDPKNRISWEELFSNPLVMMKEANFIISQEGNHQIVNSQLFIQQLVVQKESLIKVQPFCNKTKQKDFSGMLGCINKVVTDIDLSESKMEDKKQKQILLDIMQEQKQEMLNQKVINEIEEVLLFNREQVFFLDKVALKISCLERIIQKPQISFCSTITQIALFLVQKAIKIITNLKKLDQIQTLFTEEQVRSFKSSNNWLIFERMIMGDQKGLEDFEHDLNQKLIFYAGMNQMVSHNTFNDACHSYFATIKELDTNETSQLKQLYVVSIYLIDVVVFQEFVSQFGGMMEKFWRYYESIEQVTDIELEESGIQSLLSRIDQLKL